MNTIKNPLILNFKNEYKVNKPGDQSGEYVDKALAEEMLEALEQQQTVIRRLLSGSPLRNTDEVVNRVENLISKAKG